jgi:integrase
MAKIHFTKALIEALEPTGKLQSFTDDQTRGLTLKITPAGVKTFYLVKKFKGRVESTKLGRFPETTLAMARDRIAKLKQQYDGGINPAEERRQQRRELTLDAFFEVYHRDHCRAHNRRPGYARYTYEHYVGPTLGRKKLSEIQRADVIELHAKLGRSGRPRTANKAQGLLRAILNKALAWEYLKGENPAHHVQRFREVSRDRFMSKVEVARFHDALAKEPDATIRDFFLVLLYTGTRKSEALRMAWRDLDLVDGIWRIPDTKSGEPRRVVLAAPTLAILEQRKAVRDAEQPNAGWVFPGRVHGQPLAEPKRAWERVLDRAGIDDLRIHDLRRTHASWMLAGGADLTIIGKALGHKDHGSTLVYARLDLDPIRKHVESTVDALAPKEAPAEKQKAKPKLRLVKS